MDLTTTPTEVLNMMFDLADVSTHDDCTDIMIQIEQELQRRATTTETSVKTGYRIEFYAGHSNRWVDAKESYFGQFPGGVNRFFTSVEKAKDAITKLNVQIKNKQYEYWTTKIKPENIRFVRITTIRETGV